MNYSLEITKKVEEFCNTEPYPDKIVDYLKSASKVLDLYLESISIGENGINENERLVEIYDEISKIVRD